MAPASLILDRKLVLDDGRIIQMRVWLLPQTSAERPHGLKYSFFFGRPGERIIGYDNERGKGDHRHYGDHEEAYDFQSLEQLVQDFGRDVEQEIRR